MPMVTKLVRVVTYRKEVPPVELHDLPILWSNEVRVELNTLYRHFQNTCEHQTSQVGDLLWETSTFNITCHFDYVTNVGLRSNKGMWNF